MYVVRGKFVDRLLAGHIVKFGKFVFFLALLTITKQLSKIIKKVEAKKFFVGAISIFIAPTFVIKNSDSES